MSIVASVLASFAISSNVLAFEEDVKGISRVDTATMLALIHLESTGETGTWSPSGNHAGILQIGQSYLDDALDYAGRDADQITSLLNNPAYSFLVFQWYMEKYAYVHNWEPQLIALTHKAGAPAALRVIRELRGGVPLRKALETSGVPGALLYMERFETYREVYADFLLSRVPEDG